MQLPDALITDLDGTLLLRDRPVDPRNVTAARRWLSTGRPLIVATARGPSSAAQVLGDLDHCCDRGVFHTGALGHCRTTGFAAADLVPMADVAAVCQLVAASRSDALIGLSHPERGLALSLPLSAAIIAEWGVDPNQLRPFEEACCDEACKITVGCAPEAEPLHTVVRELENRLAGAVDCHLVDRGTCLLITAPGVNKASMLKRLLHHLNLDPARCCALGDDLTDIPLLDMVGLPVAVAGGHQATIGHAQRVIPPPDEGGWATLVEEFLR